MQCKSNETVSIGIVEWPSKAAHDEGMPRVIAEMGEAMKAGTMSEPPFDSKRMIFGGFETVLDKSGHLLSGGNSVV